MEVGGVDRQQASGERDGDQPPDEHPDPTQHRPHVAADQRNRQESDGDADPDLVSVGEGFVHRVVEVVDRGECGAGSVRSSLILIG